MYNPEYLQLDDLKIKINTDFRNAIKCQQIMQDNSITDYEKIIGAIYTILDIDDINILPDKERALKGIANYLQGRPSAMKPSNKQNKPDMDYIKDWNLISASMKQEYGIDINKEKIHWWTFYDYLNGLSSECIFNKVRDIRTRDISKIKDEEDRNKLSELKRMWSLDNKEIVYTKEQQENIERFYQLTGIDRE